MATLQNVRNKIDWEGFDYALRNWNFADVEDPEFQRLRKRYVKAADLLEKYLHQRTVDEEEE